MDLEALLAPVADDSPCGDDLSFSPELDAIQELRRADDPSLDQGEWITALKTADWAGVQAQCEQLLVSRTKDLRVAAWLVEAKARLAGYARLAAGLELCDALCDRWWSELHPRIGADGDTDERSGNLRWLLVQVQALARELPALRHGPSTYSLREMETAQPASARAAEAEGDTAPAAASAETIAAARRATPLPFFAINLADAQRALQALNRLQTLCDARLGDDGPAFAPARRALEDAVHGVKLLAGDAAPVPGAAGDSGVAVAAAADAAGSGSGPLRTRADALRQLRFVADFFRRTEPHSPVAYLAERAAQWGEMPLHEWLGAVVKDPGTLAQMQELLGVLPPPPPGE